MPSRMCSAAAPSMTAWGRVSNCQVPWPGVTTNEEPPSRAMAAWKDAKVRSDGLKNTSPRIFPASARRCGAFSSRSASASKSRISARSKSARSRKRFMQPHSCGNGRERFTQTIDVTFVQDVGRQQSQHLWIAARTCENAFFEECRVHFFGGPGGLEAEQ